MQRRQSTGKVANSLLQQSWGCCYEIGSGEQRKRRKTVGSLPDFFSTGYQGVPNGIGDCGKGNKLGEGRVRSVGSMGNK